jgi:hypothetical protein
LLTAARILTALQQPVDPLRLLLDNAPPDDEPYDDDLEGGPTESGRTISHEELIRELEIDE